MPASKTNNGKSEVYSAMKRCAISDFDERNDCGVIAVALACGFPYAVVHKAFEMHGRKHRQGVSLYETQIVLAHLGFKPIIWAPKKFISQYPASHQILKSVTTHHPERFHKVWKDGKRYIFVTASHMSAVIDGRTMDWAEGHAKRCKQIWEIVPDPDNSPIDIKPYTRTF